jgi:hypothetical protein
MTDAARRDAWTSLRETRGAMRGAHTRMITTAGFNEPETRVPARYPVMGELTVTVPARTNTLDFPLPSR